MCQCVKHIQLFQLKIEALIEYIFLQNNVKKH